METIGNFTIGEIKQKIVAIVMFGPDSRTSGMKPGEYYQVTIDPACVSPSGRFVRFGNSPGDEIVGWQRCEALTIVEVLGSWDESGENPMLKYGDSMIVPMMIADKVEVK